MVETKGVQRSGKLSSSNVVEQLAHSASSSVFIYDLAEHVGFGSFTKELAHSGVRVSNVISVQTRAGAGLGLVGRLSKEEGTDNDRETVITAYTTPSGLASMIQSFAFISPPTSSSRLVIQVPTVTHIGKTLELSPTLAPISFAIDLLPAPFAVFFSATPQECVDLAEVCYVVSEFHTVHFFDHHDAGREIGVKTSVKTPPQFDHGKSVPLREAVDAMGYSFYDYDGDVDATVAIVLLNGQLAASAKAMTKSWSGLGIISVRVLRPWDDQQFLDALPSSLKELYVIDEVPTEGTQGFLYKDIFSAILDSTSSRPSVRPIRVIPSLAQEYLSSPSVFGSFLEELSPSIQNHPPTLNSTQKSIIFLGSPSSPLVHLSSLIVDTFLPSHNVTTRLLDNSDMFSKPGGITCSRLVLSTADGNTGYVPMDTLLPLSDSDAAADLLVIYDQSLLKTHSLLQYLKPDSSLLLYTSWTAVEIVSNVPHDVLKAAAERSIRLYRLDVNAIAAEYEDSSVVALLVGHLAFLRLYLGGTASEGQLKTLSKQFYGDAKAIDSGKLNAKVWAALEEVDLTLSDAEPLRTEVTDLRYFQFNTVNPKEQTKDDTSLPGAYLSSWHDAARHILFPDVFSPLNHSRAGEDNFAQNPALRPEVPDRTFLVTCSVNRRLTPLDYDRNVFHLEFDTSGTGLTYAIGEALAVHGWNDTDDIVEFCRWYGVDADRLVTIPVPSADGRVHTRTVFQALQQQIDMFGHPPKSFYADLANHATKKEDRMSLQFIGSAEGSSTYKKLSEKDTVTFADVLAKYKSARPSIELLCEMVGDIKPRHYSIASAQSVVGDRVDLLVVTVEWATPSGSPRYGQCTRYLAELKVGQKLTVSIKPSVMKLPPDNMQPLILAGLGTGAAPFRAFLQHRSLLAAQGIPVGPLYYYFGSRYRSKEYLYGEEVEAFILDKTITRAGLAFSRDSKRKVYIQHLMTQDSEDLVRMLHRENGVFYLCGPTWPVPDVYETLVSALVKYNGLEAVEAGDYLEGLKEEERYVLEVY